MINAPPWPALATIVRCAAARRQRLQVQCLCRWFHFHFPSTNIDTRRHGLWQSNLHGERLDVVLHLPIVREILQMLQCGSDSSHPSTAVERYPNKNPLYEVYVGLIIKGTIPRVPPFSLWILSGAGFLNHQHIPWAQGDRQTISHFMEPRTNILIVGCPRMLVNGLYTIYT